MNSIAWTSDRRILISGGDDGVIKVGERRRRHVVMERGEGRVGIRLLVAHGGGESGATFEDGCVQVLLLQQ